MTGEERQIKEGVKKERVEKEERKSKRRVKGGMWAEGYGLTDHPGQPSS